MIVIDPSSKGATGINTATKKLKNNSRSKFLSKVKTENNQASEQIQEVADVQSIICLHEIDGKNELEQKTLKEFGDKAIDLLKSLQLALLKDNLSINNLQHLQNIAKNIPKLGDPKLAKIVEAIDLKIAVEIAKIEVNILNKDEDPSF